MTKQMGMTQKSILGALLIIGLLHTSESFASAPSCQEIFKSSTEENGPKSEAEANDVHSRGVALARDLIALEEENGSVGLQVEAHQFLSLRYVDLMKNADEALASFAGSKDAKELKDQAQILRASNETVLKKALVVSRLLDTKLWVRIVTTAKIREKAMDSAVNEIRRCRTVTSKCIADNTEKIKALRVRAKLVTRTGNELSEELAILTTALDIIKDASQSNKALESINISGQSFATRFANLIGLLDGSLSGLDEAMSTFLREQTGLDAIDHNLTVLTIRGAPESIRKLEEPVAIDTGGGSAIIPPPETGQVSSAISLLLEKKDDSSTWAQNLDKVLKDRRSLSEADLRFIMRKFPTRLNWGSKGGGHNLDSIHSDMTEKGFKNWARPKGWVPMTLIYLHKLIVNYKPVWRRMSASHKAEAAAWVTKVVDQYIAEYGDGNQSRNLDSTYTSQLHAYFLQLFVKASE